MRKFIIYSGKGATTPDFIIKDLPGSGGRMDLNARCVISTLWLSGSMREDSSIYISLNGEPDAPLVITFNGGELRKVSPDERSISIWIKKALERKDIISKKGNWLETHDGIAIARKTFEELLEERMKKGSLYLLHETGKDVRKEKLNVDPVFVLGDHMGLPEEKVHTVEKLAEEKLSLGPETYLSSQCITIVQNELDRRY